MNGIDLLVMGASPYMNDLADTFNALSDETRLQIITLLLERDELCVCDFVGALGLTQSKASRHLRYLYHAGLVEDRREGLWMHYRISPHVSVEQATIIEALSKAVGAEQKRDLQQRLDDWFTLKDESRTSDGVKKPGRGVLLAGRERQASLLSLDPAAMNVASLAPSFPVYFACHPLQLVTAMKRAGFAFVEETVSVLPHILALRKRASEAGDRPLLGESCPKVMRMIREEYPHLLSWVAAVPSPMELHGRLLKQKYGASATTVFCSPCGAKKEENAAKGAMDHVMTFAELETLIEAAVGRDLSRLEKSPFDSVDVVEAARLGVLLVDVHGEDECRDYLRRYPSEDVLPYTEIVFCKGGCAHTAQVEGRGSRSVTKRVFEAWEVV